MIYDRNKDKNKINILKNVTINLNLIDQSIVKNQSNQIKNNTKNE